MRLPLVEIPLEKTIHRRAPWSKGLRHNLAQLEKYDLARVQEAGDLPITPRLPKWPHSFLVRVNGKIIWIDAWDYEHPCGQYIKGIGPALDIHCIIKIQYKNEKFPGPRQVPMYPWMMFHTDQTSWLQKCQNYKKIYDSTKKKYDIGFSGHLWNCRRKWVNALKEIPNTYCEAWTSKARPGSTKEYIQKMSEWKALACFQGKKGRYTDGKNRREVECACLGIPLVLNYKPTYLNPLLPNEHYIYVKKPEGLQIQLEKLKDEKSTKEMVIRAREWWDDNCSEKGICTTFMQIMKESGAI